MALYISLNRCSVIMESILKCTKKIYIAFPFILGYLVLRERILFVQIFSTPLYQGCPCGRIILLFLMISHKVLCLMECLCLFWTETSRATTWCHHLSFPCHKGDITQTGLLLQPVPHNGEQSYSQPMGSNLCQFWVTWKNPVAISHRDVGVVCYYPP